MATKKGFRPKIRITSDYRQGYGGPGMYYMKGVYDNRRLYDLESQSETDVAIRSERERVKWEKLWPSKKAFLAAISKRPLDTPLCSNCGEPGATVSCLNRQWCKRPKCQEALEKARADYTKEQERRHAESLKRREELKAAEVRGCDAAEAGAFHWRNGWFFKRLANGSVRVMRRERPASNYFVVDITIPAAEWASIVCSVSALGETEDRWMAAQEFHGLVAKAAA